MISRTWRSAVASGISLTALAASAPALAQSKPTSQSTTSTVTTAPSDHPGVQADTVGPLGDIVVTARRREESLLSVPVSVTAISASELQRYRTDNLEKVGELTPGLVIGQNKTAGGGTIAIRGISTSAATAGFEQPVLVNLDGLPISNGRIVALGFFDLQRVEVLKGPQALLFGKNNSAGVISLISADPTSTLSGYARLSYEFVADEVIAEGALSGPMTDTLGVRIAVRARHMQGWMYNDARSTANPFFPAYPTQDFVRRLGDSEAAARITLKWTPTSDFMANLKLLGSHEADDGTGLGNQVVGGCVNGQPRIRNVFDPFGECKRDNHTTVGLPNSVIVANGSDPRGQYGRLDALIGSFNLGYDAGSTSITSTTGYVYLDGVNTGNGDVSSFAQLFGHESQTLKSFSQEIRILTQFEGAFNVMFGGFYQDLDFRYTQRIKFLDSLNFNPANGRFVGWIKPSYTFGKTSSAFGQLLIKPVKSVEIAGGARFTREQKDSFAINTYTFMPDFPQGKSLSDRFSDDNISPEASVTWHPTARSTIYAAYKTGFKSGGFALSGTIQSATLASDLAFGSEKAEGFEIGAKGLLLGGRLRLEATAYDFKYTDLQVNTYNPATVSFTFSNAASLKQRGVDLQGVFQASEAIQLRAAMNYNHNRFGQYNGACYGGQTPALGCNVLPGPSQNLTGRRPARSPDLSANAGATMTLPTGRFKTVLTGDTFYTSAYEASETLAPSTYQPAFWRFNASVRVATDDERWEIGLVGRNLSNEYYLLTAQDKSNQAGEQRGTVARGREILLQLSTKF